MEDSISDVPLSIVLNHWILVFPVFTDLSPLKMVAIRRAPAPPPPINSQDSDSSLTASSSLRAKASNHDSHLPEQSSPLTDGKFKGVSLGKLREDNSHDTVNMPANPEVTPMAHSSLISRELLEQRRVKEDEKARMGRRYVTGSVS